MYANKHLTDVLANAAANAERVEEDVSSTAANASSTDADHDAASDSDITMEDMGIERGKT
jgi:hypothetical protein